MTPKILGALTITAFCASVLAAGAATVTDSDGDGMYSFAELLVGYPSLTEETYSSMDANADGAVDADELAAAQEGGLYPAEG